MRCLAIVFAALLFICTAVVMFLYDGSSTSSGISKWIKAIGTKNCKCKTKKYNANTLKNTLHLPFPEQNMTTLERIKARHPNLPVDFITSSGPHCHLLPEPMGINWVNTIWQSHVGPSGDQVYLYSAFYDNRIKNELRPSVGVLGVTSKTSPDVGYCYLWYDASKPPLVRRVIKTEYIDWQSAKNNRMKPYLFSCKVLSNVKPIAVSLVSEPCDQATNLLQVNGEPVRNELIAKEFNQTRNQSGLWNAAVCAPALYYFHQDFSLRIIEWFEVLKALGIAKVFVYETDVHPNIEKVLKYYEAIGYAQVTKYTYPPPYINDPSLRRVFTRDFKHNMWALENVYFTDCVLRHMHEYRFIAHFDPDELPILSKHDSFPKLMDDLLKHQTKKGKSPSVYKLHWSFFYDNITPPQSVADLPENLWALRHVMHQKKCHSNVYKIPEDVAYLGHFKLNCTKECLEKKFIEETAYSNIRSEVQEAVSLAIKEIKSLETEDTLNHLREWT